MAFSSIKRILPTSIQKAGIDHQVSATFIVDQARDAIIRLWGEERASFVNPLSYQNGVLKVDSYSASAAHALKTIEVQWMNEVNRALNERKLTRIQIRQTSRPQI
ncbi:DUF721 domain-containing protein [Candidatus Uhrbacteria bacterium]|nr:DUF721 domain-containing protein [Candidatus Uhrbacteria bacterium]MBD3284463.1 DUF721 domain-containing protein [Candidatus Uhrbacteria bacterium]